MTIEEVLQGLRQCLVNRECIKCPYYKYYYEDDIDYIGQYSCWGRLYTDVEKVFKRILSSNKKIS